MIGTCYKFRSERSTNEEAPCCNGDGDRQTDNLCRWTQVPPRLTQNTKLRKRRTDLDVTIPQSMLCGGAEETDGGVGAVEVL